MLLQESLADRFGSASYETISFLEVWQNQTVVSEFQVSLVPRLHRSCGLCPFFFFFLLQVNITAFQILKESVAPAEIEINMEMRNEFKTGACAVSVYYLFAGELQPNILMSLL